MVRPRRSSFTTAALALGLAAAAACSPSSGGGGASPAASASPSAGSITIAVEGPATGSQGPTGRDMFNAARLAVDQANAA